MIAYAPPVANPWPLFGESVRQRCENVMLASVFAPGDLFGTRGDRLQVADVHDDLRARLTLGALNTRAMLGTPDFDAVVDMAARTFAPAAVAFYRQSIPQWIDVVSRSPALVKSAVDWLVSNRGGER